MIPAKRTAMGAAMGKMDTDQYPMSSRIRQIEIPRPARSSMYFQTICMSSINTLSARVLAKIWTKFPMKYRSSLPKRYLVFGAMYS